jgi:hypothetical protein
MAICRHLHFMDGRRGLEVGKADQEKLFAVLVVRHQ